MKLHKLRDTLSGVEVIADDKWLPIYKRRAEMEYLGPIDEAPQAAPEVAEDTTTKRKKNK